MWDEELSMRDGKLGASEPIKPDPKYVSKMSCVCRVCGFAVVDSDICLGCEKKEKEKESKETPRMLVEMTRADEGRYWAVSIGDVVIFRHPERKFCRAVIKKINLAL